VSAAVGLITRIRAAVDVVYREIVKFGAVGAVAYVVDVYVYNLLRTGWWPLTEAPLEHKPLMAKVVSVGVATVVAWLGNRYWTFRHRRKAAMRQEFVLFAVMNVGGLLISAGCIGFSHYVLGLDSALADNISGNVIGLGLGTIFRFWAYRTFVFTDLRAKPAVPAPAASPEATSPVAVAEPGTLAAGLDAVTLHPVPVTDTSAVAANGTGTVRVPTNGTANGVQRRAANRRRTA